MKTSSEIGEWRRSRREELTRRRTLEVAGPSKPDEDQWRRDDEKLDQALKGTFPASDPFSLK